MRFYLLLLLFSISTFGQHKSLDVKIDSVKSTDSISGYRVFTINYHIENLTEKKLSFFLNTNSIIGNAHGSSRYEPTYRIFQGNQFLNIENLSQNIPGQQTREMDVSKMTDNQRYEYFTARVKERLLDVIVTLNPKEIKNSSVKLSWDKKRYFNEDDYEYYIDEKAPHQIELFVNLLKEEFAKQLDDADCDAIMKNKNFIKGVYLSNKMDIDFSE